MKRKKILVLSMLMVVLIISGASYIKGVVSPRLVIANLVGNVTTSNANPLSGATFDVDVLVNSTSNGSETSDGIKDYTIKFTVPNGLSLSYAKNHGQYSMSPTDPQAGDEVTLKFKEDIAMAQLQKVKLGFKFEEGISAPADSYLPEFTLSASNADGVVIQGPVVKVRNNPIPDIMEVSADKVNPTFLHNAIVSLKPEYFIGGLNHDNSKVTIELPLDADVYSVVYNKVSYPVVTTATSKTVTIDLGSYNVSDNAKNITILYSYPPLTSVGSKEYEIKVSYDATRYRTNELIHEEDFIKEKVTYEISSGPSNTYFSKKANESIFRDPNEALSFEIDFNPMGDMKNPAIIDDPLRGGESDFFNAVHYDTILWQAYPGLQSGYDKGISTTIYYELNSNPGVWVKGSEATISGSLDIKTLGLGSDFVTKVKYEFSYQGQKLVAAKAGSVKIRMFSLTQPTVAQTGLSYDNGISNYAYLTGSKKAVQASEYEAIVDDGISNVVSTDTLFRAGGAYLGYAGFEYPFSPGISKVNEKFTYQINVSNHRDTLYDAVAYLVIPKTIKIENVRFLYGQKNAVVTYLNDDPNYQTIMITFNEDMPYMNYWNKSQFQLAFDAIGLPGVNAAEPFKLMYASNNPAQNYAAQDSWQNIPNIGGVHTAISYTNYKEFNLVLDITPSLKSSVDGIEYNQTSATQVEDVLGEDAYYEISVISGAATEYDLSKAHLIMMLPEVSDTMSISDNKKNSTFKPKVKSITNLSDDSAIDLSIYDLYYSSDATSTTNMSELTDFNNVSASWLTWDGNSVLPDNAKAIKIVKKDGLLKAESINFKLNVTLPSGLTGNNVAWLAMSVGGMYISGLDEKYIVPGEPNKAGIYVSSEPADKKIAGKVWNDLNGNNIFDDGEILINQKILVTLYDWNNDLVQETYLNNGAYEFNNLVKGKYKVVFNNPYNYHLVDYKVGSDAVVDSNFLGLNGDEVTLNANVDLNTETNPLNIDAGLYTNGSIGDYVWLDANGDGVQGSSEKGISNINVKLYLVNDDSSLTLVTSTKTNSTGKYIFNNLKPGLYQVQLDNIGNYYPTLFEVGGNSAKDNSKLDDTLTIKDINLNSGLNNMALDMGLNTVVELGSVAFKKVDEESSPLKDATFGIWLSNADLKNDEPIAQVTSDVDGMITFTNLENGSYKTKEITAPTGYHLNKIIYDATIVEDDLHVILDDVENIAIKGQVKFTKKSDNGSTLAGATFGLYSEDADLEVDDALFVAVSDVDGVVTFSDLPITNYIIKEQVAPTGYHLSSSIYQVELSYEDNEIVLADVINVKVRKLAGHISEDINGNDLYDSKEPLISGIELFLYDSNDVLIDSTITNDEGYYEFDGLYPLSYKVIFKMPLDYYISNKLVGNDLSIDDDYVLVNDNAEVIVDLTTQTKPLNIDALMYQQVSLGDYVWYDTNNNGLQDTNELGAKNTEMQLYQVDKKGETLISSVKTDNNGNYKFSKLKPASYLVKAKAVTNYDVAIKNKGAKTTNYSSFNQDWKSDVITLNSSMINNNIDLGLVAKGTNDVIKTGQSIKMIMLGLSLSLIGTSSLIIRRRYN